MSKLFKIVAPLLALAISACSSGGSSSVPVSGIAQAPNTVHAGVPTWLSQHLARAECPRVPGKAQCQALRVLKNGIVPASCNPASSCGFTAQQLESAYGLTAKKLNKGANTKVALIEVGDYSAATSDLATYRTEYGLGTANLARYNSSGQQSNYPPSCQQASWCVETALDMDMVSASCPKCTIYIMEAQDSITDLEASEQEAVALGATVLSNSWSCPNNWDCGDSNFPNAFKATGIAYLASTGDYAYNTIGGPSVLPTVLGIGGTQLESNGSKFTETAWSDASSGCGEASVVGENVPKPSWQTDPGCTSRTDGDISSESGCSPGVAMYSGMYGGWIGECGTSVASPFLAGVVAIAGNGAKLNAGQYVWTLTAKQMKARLHPIKSGQNGSCGGSYLCTAGTKQFGNYSGPTGWGTPKTVTAL
jgi:subtilase family serine protease